MPSSHSLLIGEKNCGTNTMFNLLCDESVRETIHAKTEA